MAALKRLSGWLGAGVRVDRPDRVRHAGLDGDVVLGAPERVLDADARNAISGFARMPDALVSPLGRHLGPAVLWHPCANPSLRRGRSVAQTLKSAGGTGASG